MKAVSLVARALLPLITIAACSPMTEEGYVNVGGFASFPDGTQVRWRSEPARVQARLIGKALFANHADPSCKQLPSGTAAAMNESLEVRLNTGTRQHTTSYEFSLHFDAFVDELSGSCDASHLTRDEVDAIEIVATLPTSLPLCQDYCRALKSTDPELCESQCTSKNEIVARTEASLSSLVKVRRTNSGGETEQVYGVPADLVFKELSP